jgi:cytidine deaminase
MKTKNKIPSHIQKLFKEALSARKKAYAPYSKFKVGAALIANKKIYSGCNIENSSFGATICAERTAIAKAASLGAIKIEDIVVVTDLKDPVSPCGLCRQVIAEFAGPKTRVWIANTKGIVRSVEFAKLFPLPMGAQGKWFKG